MGERRIKGRAAELAAHRVNEPVLMRRVARARCPRRTSAATEPQAVHPLDVGADRLERRARKARTRHRRERDRAGGALGWTWMRAAASDPSGHQGPGPFASHWYDAWARERKSLPSAGGTARTALNRSWTGEACKARAPCPTIDDSDGITQSRCRGFAAARSWWSVRFRARRVVFHGARGVLW